MNGIPWTTCLTVLLAIVAMAAQNTVKAARASESSVRQMATEAPKPAYPPASVKAKVSGVAIVSVLVDTNGKATAEVLEAPDAHIAAAVKDAVSSWTFRTHASVPITARLTFYFRLENGKPRVLNPDEMPRGAPAGDSPATTHTTTKPRLPAGGALRVTPDDIVVTTISFDEFSRLTGDARPLILDVGDRAAFKRGHQPGAVNIPLEELIVRGPIELRGQKFVVIDCTQEEMSKCKFAAHYLEDAAIGRVALLQR